MWLTGQPDLRQESALSEAAGLFCFTHDGVDQHLHSNKGSLEANIVSLSRQLFGIVYIASEVVVEALQDRQLCQYL